MIVRQAVVAALCGVAGSGSAVSVTLAQAPPFAQVWDVRFIADQSGPYAAGPTASQVGITMYARVGILPNTSATGTANFGVSRVGGAGSGTTGFRVLFSDGASRVDRLREGFIEPGRTSDIDGRDLLDTSGEPLRGHFAPFRGGFGPQEGPQFLGANSSPFNGEFFNPATTTPALANLIGSRTLHFGSEGTGRVGVAATPTDANPANLIGDLTPVYRLYFTPTPGFSGRVVTGSVRDMSARYLLGLAPTGDGLHAPAVDLPDREFAFVVPGPGGAVLGFAAVAAGLSRRRRGM